MRNKVSKALFLGILTFLLSLGSCLKMGERCPHAGRENTTCNMLMNCPEDLKILAEMFDPNDRTSLGKYVNENYLCGEGDEDFLFCCHSPLKLEVVEDVSEHPNLGLLRRDICGPTPTGHRIVNGEEADPNEFPWMAAVVTSDLFSYSWGCSGTVIADRYVLTAAHCIGEDPPNYVWLGKHNIMSFEDCEEVFLDGKTENICVQKIPVEDIIVHPNYIHEPLAFHDIALLRLSDDISFASGAVKPVCLPIGLEQQKPNLIGRRAKIVGYGKTEKGLSTGELRKATVRINEYSKCTYAFPTSTVTQICAGDTDPVRSNCNGDSGGPLTLDVDVRGELRTIQYGIVSYGAKDCLKGSGEVYTHVGHYMKWILDNIKP